MPFPVQMRALKPNNTEVQNTANEGANSQEKNNSLNNGLQPEKPSENVNTKQNNISNMPTKANLSSNDEKLNDDKINNPQNFEELDLRAAVNERNKHQEEEKLGEKKTEEGKQNDHTKNKLEMRLDPNILKSESNPFKPRPKYSRKACGCAII